MVKLSLILILFFVGGCSKIMRLNGTLTVKNRSSGTFEIYRLASESPLQFVSEQAGNFNEEMSLPSGSYLVLADCSSKMVNIYPKSSQTLVAHQVNFIPMHPVEEGDRFSIQCVRSEQTNSRVELVNKFSLNVLAGQRDILVGMLPLSLDLDFEDESSHLVSHVLGSVKVEQPGNFKEPFEFYISPLTAFAPNTESQHSNAALLLLEGDYVVELNGTENNVEIKNGEYKTIKPALLEIKTPVDTDLNLAANIKGSPLHAEINGEHWFHLNTVYPVLPGSLEVRLNTSFKPVQFEIEESEKLTMKARSVTVSLGCKPADWQCLGSRKIRLYEKDKTYPIAESISDIPFLYLEHGVSIGVEGSRNIRYTLPEQDAIRLKLGYVEITPQPSHRPGVLTDLMRVEAVHSPQVGFTLDLALDRPTTVPLIPGSYVLAQYSYFPADGSRRRMSQGITVRESETIKLALPTFLSEKRLATIKKNEESPQ
jgi:hypothetical protein